MPFLHVTAIRYQEVKDGAWKVGLAVLDAPGLSCVKTIIQPDGTTLPLDIPVYDYHINSYLGAMSIDLEG